MHSTIVSKLVNLLFYSLNHFVGSRPEVATLL